MRKINKIASVTSEIDEQLETVDFPHNLPDFKTVEKTCGKLVELCQKLEKNAE